MQRAPRRLASLSLCLTLAFGGCSAQTKGQTAEAPSPRCGGQSSSAGTEEATRCRSLMVPGGSFLRDADPRFFATVSTFWLDEHEVTVGRLREFVGEYDAFRQAGHPSAGDGLAPNNPAIAWQSAFDAELPATALELTQELVGSGCVPNEATWSDTPGAYEALPINCVTWFEAFAFCSWDGGWLPTELEYTYAAAGGSEQHKYPWGDEEPARDTELAVYGCLYSGSSGCSRADIAPVGSAPKGRARWGHLDLSGSMREWVFDRYAEPYPEVACHDCANADSGEHRSFRGGSWYQGSVSLETGIRNNNLPSFRSDSLGFRCARAKKGGG